jgi:glycerate dehydrogenase
MKAVFLDFDTLGPNDLDISPLTEQLPELELFASTDPGQVAKRITGAEIVIVNKVRLDEESLRSAGELKLVCLAATGTDNVALSAAQELGIAVCNIRDYCTPSVVQHVFALILTLTNHLREYQALLTDGAWSKQPSFCLLDHSIPELRGKTLGIVGLGTLGSAVAEVAGAFGMRVIAMRRSGDSPATDVERVGLDELLERSDIVSLHCPINADTENLINADTLRKMRSNAILINTARGGLVDSHALVDALKRGTIAGAGIDVLVREPPVDPDPILEARLPNLVVTPHIAWAARESRQRALEQIAENVSGYIKGEIRNRVV